jgi:hypothetical protein
MLHAALQKQRIETKNRSLIHGLLHTCGVRYSAVKQKFHHITSITFFTFGNMSKYFYFYVMIC